MTDPVLGMVMLGSFILVILLGFPVAFTLMAMGIGFGYVSMQERVFDLLVQRTYAVMANDVLISVPLFIFMGYVIERANILDRLFRALQLASGGLPGALAVATLATCAMFATATPQSSAGMADPAKIIQSHSARHRGWRSLLRNSKATPRTIRAASMRKSAR